MVGLPFHLSVLIEQLDNSARAAARRRYPRGEGHWRDEALAVEAQIGRILSDRRRAAEAILAKAEIDVTELRKLETYAASQVDALAHHLAAAQAASGEVATPTAPEPPSL